VTDEVREIVKGLLMGTIDEASMTWKPGHFKDPHTGHWLTTAELAAKRAGHSKIFGALKKSGKAGVALKALGKGF